MNSERHEAGSGWLLVLLLLLAYALSFIDRQILSLLVDDLRRDLAVTDSQIGLLQGPAFGVFYAIMGLPFGWFADRVHRLRLIAAGLLLWTAMTFLGGLADSFAQLFVTRMGVGVGEAALVPAAVSLLADSFRADRRALPMATFTAGVSVGAGLALLGGSTLIAWTQGGATALPLIGPIIAEREAWQGVLILAGLLGAPLALLLLALPEPRRQLPVGDASGLFALLSQQRTLLLCMLGGSSALYVFSYAWSAWMPTLFIRQFGWSPTDVGLKLGPWIMAAAVAGNIASGGFATWLGRRGVRAPTLATMAAGAVLLCGMAIVAPLAPDATAARIAAPAVFAALAFCFGVATAAFVAVTPAHLRGQMTALYLSAGNLVGLGLGPPAVGVLLTNGFRDPSAVGVAITLVAAATTIVGAALLVAAAVRASRSAGSPHR